MKHPGWEMKRVDSLEDRQEHLEAPAEDQGEGIREENLSGR